MNMEQKNEKYLPVGSVVILKGATKKVMVTGFCIVPDGDPTKMFDYSGCLYPEGMLSSKETAVFNHDQIDRVFFLGYVDEDEVKFKTQLKEEVAKVGK